MIDWHSHILPGIDDVPAEIGQSVVLAEALAAGGFTEVYCTPHLVRGCHEAGNEKMAPSWSKELEELIVYAITGERQAVVRKLDALVKGYKPMYEFHGGPEATDADYIHPKTAEQARSCELPLNRDRREPHVPNIPLPSPPSKSVH